MFAVCKIMLFSSARFFRQFLGVLFFALSCKADTSMPELFSALFLLQIVSGSVN